MISWSFPESRYLYEWLCYKINIFAMETKELHMHAWQPRIRQSADAQTATNPSGTRDAADVDHCVWCLQTFVKRK
jgi:hypothetical protein